MEITESTTIFPIHRLNYCVSEKLGKIITADIPGSLNKGLKNAVNLIDDGRGMTECACIDKDILEMNLYDFNGMLNSNLLTIYNNNKFETELDLNHPLPHYLINSTHNTYLTGNQLYGTSHSKMYAYAMLRL